VEAVRYRININTLEKQNASELHLNDIGAVVIQTQKPLFCDPYRRNRATGSFILVDPMTNATVAAGMVTGREPVVTRSAPVAAETFSVGSLPISRLEQQSRTGHRAVAIWVDAPSASPALRLERALFDANCRVHAVPANDAGAALDVVCRNLIDAGVITIVYGSSDASVRDALRSAVGNENFVEWNAAGEDGHTDAAVDGFYRRMEDEGIIFKNSQGD